MKMCLWTAAVLILIISVLDDVYEKKGVVLLHRYRRLDNSVLKDFGIQAKCFEGIKSMPQYFIEELVIFCLVLLLGLVFLIVAIKQGSQTRE